MKGFTTRGLGLIGISLSLASTAGLFAVGASAKDLAAESWDNVPRPQCPAKPSDSTFLPCGAKFQAQMGVGIAMQPYRSQALPTDGPLLDIMSGDRAVRSRNGLLDKTTIVRTGTAANPMKVGSKPYEVYTYTGASRLGGAVASYDGVFPAKTLIAEPGDTVRLTIKDERIPDAQLQRSPNSFDPTDPTPDSSNIHFHGVLTSPAGPSDNIYRTFVPGETYLTEMHIPGDHDEGTNWFHPHYHTSTTAQVAGGMSGILQIGDIANKRPEFAGLKQRFLVLRGMALAPSDEHPGKFLLGPSENGNSPIFEDPDPSAAQGSPSIAPAYVPTYFVNGQLNPLIDMRPGETQIWTIASVNAFSGYSLGIFRIGKDGTIDDPAPLFRSTLIAQDGNDYFTPVKSYFTKQRNPLKDTFLGPGERLVWAITAPLESGDYHLVNVVDSAYTNQVANLPEMLTFEPPTSHTPSVIIATVRVGGSPVTTPPPETITNIPEPPELRAEPDVVRNQITFDFEEKTLRGRINFGTFPDLAIVQSYSGDVEEWVVSTYSQVSHPFHIHQGQFVIDKIEYYEDLALTKLRTDLPQNPIINDVPREMDTFAFPGRSKVYLKLRTSQFTGKFVMHCHLLLHEDEGMMLSVRLVPPREEVLTAIGASPGEAPEVSVAKATTGNKAGVFNAYVDDYRGGVSAAAGNVTGVYRAHVVTVGKSGAPLVRVFDRGKLHRALFEFIPFGGAGDGATVAVGDVNGDAIQEIIVGSGKGTTPSVAVYAIERQAGTSIPRLLYEVPVLDEGYRHTGVRVASADIDGDNWDDIVVANGPGAVNRIAVLSGQVLWEQTNPAAKSARTSGSEVVDRSLRLSTMKPMTDGAIIADEQAITPGTGGLNIAADVFGGGFPTYPPVTNVGTSPPVEMPFRAMIAVTSAAVQDDPQVVFFRYSGPGSHSHGMAAEAAPKLHSVAIFTPYPGERSRKSGLELSSGLTLVGDKNNPLAGLVSARSVDDQRVSYYDRNGRIITEAWAEGQ